MDVRNQAFRRAGANGRPAAWNLRIRLRAAVLNPIAEHPTADPRKGHHRASPVGHRKDCGVSDRDSTTDRPVATRDAGSAVESHQGTGEANL